MGQAGKNTGPSGGVAAELGVGQLSGLVMIQAAGLSQLSLRPLVVYVWARLGRKVVNKQNIAKIATMNVGPILDPLLLICSQ
ncbi:hypothetical protein C943_01584 [Mariniradius saccharolyticus AK6]|uniref:Uncharacterized protein n=1 Tax=Mariniradius saccharolyticus AK6 TaxID=1239962 RepID=M7XAU0_9BACT|nr:hypothetical protein C943_01584 [Mariniradius saccharolyticus AK6]